MTMPDNKPMTNEEYRDAVAKRLGWHTRPGGGWSGLSYIDANGEQVSTELDFQPDNDWASAGVWIEWLFAHCIFVGGQHGEVRLFGDGFFIYGYGKTFLDALKSASEQFLERSKT